jgi:cell shape-determining protein MreC
VIARPPQSPYDTLVLNIGSEDGVRLDAGVWWPAGVYLGKVIDVRFRSAVVQLLSAPGVIHPASISATPVTTLGQGGGEFYAEVPQDRAVSVGTVIISDQYNLPLGVVAATQIISATNMQALYITRFVSAASLEYVYVEK